MESLRDDSNVNDNNNNNDVEDDVRQCDRCGVTEADGHTIVAGGDDDSFINLCEVCLAEDGNNSISITFIKNTATLSVSAIGCKTQKA